MAIVDAPKFVEGEEIILFLGADAQAMFPVVGFNQGKFRGKNARVDRR